MKITVLIHSNGFRGVCPPGKGNLAPGTNYFGSITFSVPVFSWFLGSIFTAGPVHIVWLVLAGRRLGSDPTSRLPLPLVVGGFCSSCLSSPACSVAPPDFPLLLCVDRLAVVLRLASSSPSSSRPLYCGLFSFVAAGLTAVALRIVVPTPSVSAAPHDGRYHHWLVWFSHPGSLATGRRRPRPLTGTQPPQPRSQPPITPL